MRAGDALLGLASSGLHSNGFSLVRRIIESGGAALGDRAPFDPGRRLGEALLEPTRIYVRALLAAIGRTDAITGLAHITGGGLTENVPRALPDHLAADIDPGAIAVPPVFAWLAREGGIAADEMLRTFNCGIGMVAIVAADRAEAVATCLREEGETVVPLGRLAPREGAPVTYRGAPAL